MNTNPNYKNQDSNDEISLQELFMALWRQKIFIIVITVIAALLTGIFSVFAITPIYHSRLSIIINMPETHHTKYGEYELPLTTNEQYINLITSNDILMNTIEDMGYDAKEMAIETLRNLVSIEQINTNTSEQNSFSIKVASDNPQKAKQLASVLYDNYIEFIDIMVAEGAIEYFINYYSVQIKSLQVELETNKELLEKNKALLEETPMTIKQKEVMDEILSSDKQSDYIIIGDIINPNYTELELDIIEIKQSINSLNNSVDLNNNYIKELEEKRSAISKYYETREYEGLNLEIVSATKSNIYLASEPVAPSNKTSPNNTRNIIIGALIGGMVAVLIALIREYWFKEK